MAKKKKTAKRKTSRRRRIGAINPSSPLVKFGSIGAGYFLGNKIDEMLVKVTGDKVDGKILAAAQAGLGLMLMMKGKKTAMKQIAGGVLLGSGARKGLREFGVINGFDDVPVIAGYRDVPVISGYNVPSGKLNGYNVPQPVHKTVLAGINDGSGVNASDR